jgi:hypothetical protein
MMPLEMVFLARNKLSKGSLCERSMRAAFFIGSISDHMTAQHQTSRNLLVVIA